VGDDFFHTKHSDLSRRSVPKAGAESSAQFDGAPPQYAALPRTGTFFLARCRPGRWAYELRGQTAKALGLIVLLTLLARSDEWRIESQRVLLGSALTCWSFSNY
jgi:hypothetical protein